ncbi:hypothetical protein BC567DRAFT_277736, partial [Phyllosticta citribraziliensis]
IPLHSTPLHPPKSDVASAPNVHADFSRPRPPVPNQRNPLILPEHTPALDILVERRRLGQTNLQVKSGQVAGPSKQPEVTDLFDYAHLRVPLPKDLNGSGIFSLSSYILMRRSSDGFISATGMFNVGGPAFPWASQDDEEQERIYHKHPDERRRSWMCTFSRPRFQGCGWIRRIRGPTNSRYKCTLLLLDPILRSNVSVT